jgi:hypothetical protein
LHCQLVGAGTLRFTTTGTTGDVTGAMPYAANDGPSWDFQASIDGVLAGVSGDSLAVLSTGTTLKGWAIVSQEP